MKLFWKGCKRTICLVILAFVLCLGLEAIGASAEGSVQYDDTNTFFFRSWIRDTVGSPESITVRATVKARKGQPAGAEIYRAALTADGSQGKYRKVGVCKNLKLARHGNWCFSYRDNTVKAGQRYIYKCKGFVYDGAVKIVQKNNCLTGTGVAEKSPEGNYTCRVIKNTKKKLVVKMAGISKKSIGILSPATSNPAYLAGWLVCKKSGGKEVCRTLAPEAYSYDGKEWNEELEDMAIKGKESVYLCFSRNIKEGAGFKDFSDYQYAQMMLSGVRYNWHPLEHVSHYEAPQLRLNLTTKEGTTGRYIVPEREQSSFYVMKWEQDLFECNIWGGIYLDDA